jgi:Photoprotection regulator fluorescence recovery protein
VETVPKRELECRTEDLKMTISFSSAGRASDPKEDELRWSKLERTTARKAFDHALNQELQELTQQAEQMTAAIQQPSDLWELEHHLAQRRKEIDRKYKERASKLSSYSNPCSRKGACLRDRQGLREDKLEEIRSYAGFLSRRDEPI